MKSELMSKENIEKWENTNLIEVINLTNQSKNIKKLYKVVMDMKKKNNYKLCGLDTNMLYFTDSDRIIYLKCNFNENSRVNYNMEDVLCKINYVDIIYYSKDTKCLIMFNNKNNLIYIAEPIKGLDISLYNIINKYMGQECKEYIIDNKNEYLKQIIKYNDGLFTKFIGYEKGIQIHLEKKDNGNHIDILYSKGSLDIDKGYIFINQFYLPYLKTGFTVNDRVIMGKDFINFISDDSILNYFTLGMRK